MFLMHSHSLIMYINFYYYVDMHIIMYYVSSWHNHITALCCIFCVILYIPNSVLNKISINLSVLILRTLHTYALMSTYLNLGS